MSVSSTLTSAVITLMSARVMNVEPSVFWMPSTTVSPSRTGSLVTMPSKGAMAMVRSSTFLVGAQGGFLGPQVSAGGVGVGLGLVDAGDGLGHRSHVGVVGCLLGVVILLGHDSGLVEALGAIPIELLLFQIGLGVLDVGLGSLFRGNVTEAMSVLAACDGGLLAGDHGLLLHVLDGGDESGPSSHGRLLSRRGG